MTISILAIDRKTGAMGGAAATGSLCVGGWVLRGDAEFGALGVPGLLAEYALGNGGARADARRDRGGRSGGGRGDAGRGTGAAPAGCARSGGRVGHFTGRDSIALAGAVTGNGVVVAGNMLAGGSVLKAARDAMETASGPLDIRLLAALRAAERAGGDRRGFQSAALLVVARDRAPLTLRIDHSETSLDALEALHARATTGVYAEWVASVPTLDHPERDRLPDALSRP